MKNAFLMILAGLMLTSSILACNMLRGAGEDIENTGGNIKETIDKND